MNEVHQAKTHVTTSTKQQTNKTVSVGEEDERMPLFPAFSNGSNSGIIIEMVEEDSITPNRVCEDGIRIT